MSQRQLSISELIQLLTENYSYPPLEVNLMGQIRSCLGREPLDTYLYNFIATYTDPATMMRFDNIHDLTVPLVTTWRAYQQLSNAANSNTNNTYEMHNQLQNIYQTLAYTAPEFPIPFNNKQSLINFLANYMRDSAPPNMPTPESTTYYYNETIAFLRAALPVAAPTPVGAVAQNQNTAATQPAITTPTPPPIVGSHPERKKQFIEKTEALLNEAMYMAPRELDNVSYQLYARDLPPIINHYKKKGVTIHINGDTEKGKQHLEQLRQEIETGIKNLRNADESPFEFISRVWDAKIPFTLSCGADFNLSMRRNSAYSPLTSDEEHSIISMMREGGFLSDNNHLTPKSPEKIKEFNQFMLDKLKQAGLLDRMQELSNAYANYLENDVVKNIGLPRAQCIQEVYDIQKNLNQGEAVGYIYTNQQQDDRKHFEVLVITSDAIIKPMNWPVEPRNAITTKDFTDLIYTTIDNKIVPGLSDRGTYGGDAELCAQAGATECGTLGILYLNQLLKNNASELSNQTLSFSYYENDSDQKKNFFFPSPQVLRYSQSSSYNKVLAAMLQEGTSTQVEVSYNKEKFKTDVRTLEDILSQSRDIALRRGDNATAEKNQELLNQLPAFRDQWLNDYKKAQEKRAGVQVKTEYTGKNPINVYLAYKTHQMQAKANDDANKTTGSTSAIVGKLNPGITREGLTISNDEKLANENASNESKKPASSPVASQATSTVTPYKTPRGR